MSVTLTVLTLCLFLAFAVLFGIGKREEVIRNWPQYRAHPLYMMTAFLYKPENDPRSRFQFMQDNFNIVLSELVSDTLKAVLAPILDIFQITGGGIVGSMQGVRAVQNIMKTMMDSFGKIFSIFERRYSSTLHRLAMTYHRIQTSFSRISATAVNAVYQSMATVSTLLSTVDLIMKIVIIILTILVAIVLFLFLFLWPVIPVVLAVIGILTTAGMGAAVGGMAGTFCFAESTPILMADGTTKPIWTVHVGDELGAECGKVTARLEFQQVTSDLFDLYGIRVTGSHIVWHEGRPIPVSEHPAAQKLPTADLPLFCLNTTTNRIPVLNSTHKECVVFADWEELGASDKDAQLRWNRHVWSELNPGIPWNAENAVVEGEAGLHPATLVQMGANNWIEISRLRPGDTVLDESGRPTHVLGIVELAGSEIAATEGPVSTIAWRRRTLRDSWKQGGSNTVPAYKGTWRSIITEHGTFRIITGDSVRDFTDIGMHRIQDTYDWVLDIMGCGMGKTDP